MGIDGTERPTERKKMRTLQALSTDRYIIGIRSTGVIRKLFQIIPGKGGSLYVSFPYSPFQVGRVGILKITGSGEDGVLVGENDFPVTMEKLKYTHHPSGEVHFSQ